MHYSAFIFDLDGVIWRGHAPIAGAAESVARLRELGARCFFCTNNSRATRQEFVSRLQNAGVDCAPDEVFSSSYATALYLKDEMAPGFSVYVVGEAGLVEALGNIGARVLSDADASGHADAVDCVVAGIDRDFSYYKLQIAQAHILKGARFVATNRDATFPVERGVVPGAGSIVAAIATASSVQPVTIGKPEPLMLQLCLGAFGLNPQTTAMIGDRLDTDIACAHRAGIHGLLVETGVHTRLDAERVHGDEVPDAIYKDLPALVEDLAGEKP